MALEGLDYSYSRPSIPRLATLGKRFVIRYITSPGSGAKGISQAEYDRLTSEGIAVAFVWENGAAAATHGRARGIADAQHAQANLNALKGPSNQRPLYFAVDLDVPASKVRAYFEGVNSVIGKRRTGVYGSYRVVRDLKAWGLAKFLWQTYAWSNGNTLPGINLKQYQNDIDLAGGQVDLDRAYTANYGQKAVIFAKPAPKPPQSPVADVAKVYYLVKSGDTLSEIAAKYHHGISTIAGWNGITNPNLIRVGQRLRVG